MSNKNDDATAPGENVDKIRDILFGGQMQEYERRFNKLEEKLHKESEAMQNKLDARINKLEGNLKKEVEKLVEKDKQEKKERVEAIKSIQSNLQEIIKELNKSIDEVDENAINEGKEIRGHLAEHVNDTIDSISNLNHELSELINKESKELYETKVSRVELSGFLSEFALRLTKDFELPGND